MFFSHKPTAIVFVERNKVQLYPKEGTTPLTVPDEVLQYLEIRNPAKLTELLVDFATKAKVRGKRVLVVLDKDVVFQKTVTLQKDNDPVAIKTDFEDKVPFSPEDRQTFSLQQKDRLFLFGVNKPFYMAVVHALEGAGAKIVAVAPGFVYGLTDADKLSAKFSQIADADRLTKSADFLTRS